ncbi:MAG TPA: hypothetical protein VJT50_15675 [Pyrinomonadaceae bacterium]|nr:hypothetical protein [Pyrinomonadaceae bacterium]
MKRRTKIIGVLVAFISLAWVAASAQSGRRSSRPTSPPVAVPTPETTPAPTPTPPSKDAVGVLVGIDRNGGLVNFPLYFYGVAVDNFVHQLGRDIWLRVTDGGELTRSDALKKAKESKNGYVVYLRLRFDDLRPTAASENASDVIVEYSVFAPGTARVVTSGRTFADAYRKRASIPQPTSTGTYSDYTLVQAAKAAADRVDDYLKHHRDDPEIVRPN